MGAIPTQRESMPRAPDMPAHHRAGQDRVARTSLPGTPLAPGAARRFVRGALAEWTALATLPAAEILHDRLTHDALVVVSELVTNAVVHAGTDVELLCRLESPADGAPGPLVVEVSDHHPARGVRDEGAERPYGTPEYGRGLRLVSALSEAWGITYRPGVKTIWARLPVGGAGVGDGISEGGGSEAGVSEGGSLSDIRNAPDIEQKVQDSEAYADEHALGHGPWAGTPLATEIPGPEPRRSAQQDQDWLNRGALSFLAEASDLLAGQLDEEIVASLAGQLLVPRLADWCAVWLEDEATDRAGGLGLALGPRLARVWHGSENHIEDLRRALEKDPPRLPDSVRSRAVPVPWPGEALGARVASGAALAYRLIAGGRPLGTLVIGRAGTPGFPDEITGLVEDLSRRIALAIGAARQYARQATISRVLQRGLLPGAVAEIPGVRSALVYEPLDKGGPSGDFYDLFPAGDGRWCFAVGDVQGKGPEAAVLIGLARPWLRLLAREGYEVADVLDRLNQLLLDDATEAADAAARALVAAGGPGLGTDPGPQTRFLSMLYGELVPFDGGVRCTLASAGHPLPLLLGPGGDVREVARPQTLLGVFEDADYTSETFELHSGDTVLCVTDGVTERRSGPHQFDDGDGLAQALAGCVGLSAELIAERIRRLVHEFGARPPEDDMALLVLQAE
ncbi:SpoIIE family protein phosphatase [Streptomyces sp. NPDC048415]|uniref:SpoIIE family protein phosphatase n=1 Tax=Streptomyces sp. NPDC048415 TaxID=3154822 RepID=UPI0034312840